MPVRQQVSPEVTGRLSAVAAEAWIPRTCFKHGPPGRIGVELEFLLHDLRSPSTHGSRLDALRSTAQSLPLAGRVTLEPGGQLELSSPPSDGLPSALQDVATDLRRLRRVASVHRAELVGRGLDPRDAPRRMLDHPRYVAMEAYLDRWGPAGRVMMRRTASVQVNLEAATHAEGGWDGPDRRWLLLHAVGPALVAAFATSPGPEPVVARRGAGDPTAGWADWSCTRMGVWLAMDPERTAEPTVRVGESVQQAWARWVLDAPLMLVRRREGPWTAPPGVRFRDWIDAGPAVVPGRSGPDLDDLNYHLSTLFPPVRARGHLEVRYLDAQPGDWWQVPVAVLAALSDDRAAGDRALASCAGVRGRWWDAARYGLRDAELAAAAQQVLVAAESALRSEPSTRAAGELVAAYLEHWTGRCRSPGDDLREGRPIPAASTAALTLAPGALTPPSGALTPPPSRSVERPSAARKDLPC